MNRKYYLWEIFGDDRASKNAWIITELDLLEPNDSSALVQGKRLTRWNHDNRALYPKTCEGYRTDNVYADKVFLQSARLKRLIQSFTRDEVEYYPITIERKDERKRVKGYFALVVLDPINAIDWTLTPYEEVNEEKVASDEQNVILDRSKIGNRKIFMLKGNNNAIVVRDDLVQAMRNARITGIGFTELHVIGEAPKDPEPAWLPAGFDFRVKAPEEGEEPSPNDEGFYEERVSDVLACLGETKPKTYAKKISDAKRLDGQMLGRVLIDAIQQGDWSRVALPMLVGGQVVDLFTLARISDDLWDDALEVLEKAGANCKMVPGPGYLRIYQELARVLSEMAKEEGGTEEFLERVKRFRDSRGWNWTRHWFGPRPGFESYNYMDGFDRQMEEWLSAKPVAKKTPATKAPVVEVEEAEAEEEKEPATKRGRAARKAPAARTRKAKPEPEPEPEEEEDEEIVVEDEPGQAVLTAAIAAPKERLPRPMIALSLRRKKDEDQRATKFGGLPYLPAVEPWPRCGQCGEALRFLFQLAKNDVPSLAYPGKDDLLVLYGCVNENCSNRTGESVDSSLWRYYKVKQREALVEAPPRGVDLLPNCGITFKEPEDDHYDPGFSATLSKRDKKKKFGELGENYPSVKIGGYPTFWQDAIEPLCQCGKPMVFMLQTTPDGQRTNLTSAFVNQSELFAGRLELWFHCPDWCQAEESLLRVVQKA